MSFDLQPVLKGKILELRPLRPGDFHDLYAVASDPLIWEQHPIPDRYKEEVFRDNWEMKQLMLRHAFRFLNSVIFLVGPKNLRSQRALEKIGAVRVGSRLDKDDRLSLVYQITAPT